MGSAPFCIKSILWIFYLQIDCVLPCNAFYKIFLYFEGHIKYNEFKPEGFKLKSNCVCRTTFQKGKRRYG